jgi:hypothetical protein
METGLDLRKVSHLSLLTHNYCTEIEDLRPKSPTAIKNPETKLKILTAEQMGKKQSSQDIPANK